MHHYSVKIPFSLVLHTTMVVLLGSALALFFIPLSTLSLIFEYAKDHSWHDWTGPLFLLFLFSSITWLGVFFLVRSCITSLAISPKVLRQTKGAVMTETLIIIPVFFLLVSGLAQLSINEMAGLLTTVGAFEASRSVALWAPEIGHQRFDSPPITLEDVKDRARLSAAAVIAPVVRDLVGDIQNSEDENGNRIDCDPSPAFELFSKGIESSGALSQKTALTSKVSIWSYAEALGTSNFSVRAPTKLRASYCAISIRQKGLTSIPTSGKKGSDFDLTLVYRHRPVFPIVRAIFGNMKITRTTKMRSHVPPNHNLPK